MTDCKAIAEQLAARMSALCDELLPNAVADGQQMRRIGSIAGEPGASMVIHVAGRRQGQWWDFAASHGGDALDLIRCVAFGADPSAKGSLRDAMAWAERWLGQPSPSVPRRPAAQTSRETTETAEDGKRKALAVWERTLDLRGTVGETYLRSARGITCPLPPTMRFAPAALHRCGQRGPAIVCLVESAAGEAVGTWTIWVAPDGSGKADLGLDDRGRRIPVRLGRGPCRGGSVVLSGGCPETQGWSEGIENGLAVLSLVGAWLPMRATLSTSGMQTAEPPDGVQQHLIYADNDIWRTRGDLRWRPGTLAAETMATRFQARGASAAIEYPLGFADWNDMLLDRSLIK